MYRKTLNFAGETFEVEREDFKELFQLVSHFNEMSYRLKVASKGLTTQTLTNLRWNYRTNKDGNGYYEVRATLKHGDTWYPVVLRVSENKPKTESPERLYVSYAARWLWYDGENNLQYDGPETGFVPEVKEQG